METLTIGLALLLKPALTPVSHWLLTRKRETWQYEAAFVAVVLVLTSWLTSEWPRSSTAEEVRPFLVNWLAAAAVFVSFLQANVGFRMAEAEASAERPSVHCHAWSNRYWLGKELLWFTVFLLSGAYSAIAGNVLFMVWPAWRSVHTLNRAQARR